jgi:hypothetical protein
MRTRYRPGRRCRLTAPGLDVRPAAGPFSSGLIWRKGHRLSTLVTVIVLGIVAAGCLPAHGGAG